MKTILTDEFAKELNGLHIGLENSARLLISEALVIGRKLIEAEKNCDQVDLREWMDTKLDFSRRAAYRYIDLYKYQKQIKDAENLTVAYKMISDIKSEEKQVENQKSADRVAEYKETGIKPEGWKKDTDTRRVQRMETAQSASLSKCASKWDGIYKNPEIYSDNPQTINALKELNKLKSDDERVQAMINSIDFMTDCIKAYKRAITEMGYELKE